MPTLYDAYGRKVDTGRLTGVESGPTVAGVRGLGMDHPGRNLTPEKLAAILLAAEEGDADAYLSLAEDMEERELHYHAQLNTRKRAVSQLEITVESAGSTADDKKAADLVRDWLRNDELEESLYDVCDAIGKGVSCLETVWDRSGKEWFPLRLEHRDPRYFCFDRADPWKLMIREEAGGARPLTPYKFIPHFHRAKSGFPIRGGIARVAAWAYLFKLYSLKDWVVFNELYGQPLRLGKYHPSATEDEQLTLLRAVTQLGVDAAAIIPQGMEVDFKEAVRSGSVGGYKDFLQFMNAEISKGVLGQTLTSDVSSDGGSRALGDVHNEVRADIRRSDVKQVAPALNRGIVRPLVDLNLGPRPRNQYPRLRIGLPDSLSFGQVVEALKVFVPLGLTVETDAVRERLGFAAPKEGAPVLAPPAAPAPAPAAHASARPTRSAHAADPAGRADLAGELAQAALEDSGWEEILAPVLEPFEDMAGEVSTLEELRDRLADVVVRMDVETFRELLSRNGFAAHMAGALGVGEG